MILDLYVQKDYVSACAEDDPAVVQATVHRPQGDLRLHAAAAQELLNIDTGYKRYSNNCTHSGRRACPKAR